MIVIGLTGSIAMGKTETAKMFRSLGIPVFDSDAEVHRIYSGDSEVVGRIAAMAPGAVKNGHIDRKELSKYLLDHQDALATLQAIVHPVVKRSQADFIERCKADKQDILVIDIPLLFETGRESDFDVIVVVSAPSEIQRERAMARPAMTAEKLDYILSRQVPDAEKRAKADYIVDTSQGLDKALDDVRTILRNVKSKTGIT